MSQRDNKGRRISIPDPSFIDEVGDLARSMYETNLREDWNERSTRDMIDWDRVVDVESIDWDRVDYPSHLISPTTRPVTREEVEDLRQIADQYQIPYRMDYSQIEMSMMRALGISSEYLCNIEDQNKLVEEGEFEIVARTTTNTTRRRQTRTPGRATVTAPLEKKPPLYIWVVRSSKAYDGQHVQYEAQLNTDGSVSCGCAGWKFKKKDEERRCKHTDLIKEEAKDFFKRHKRGEQLPTTDPTDEQLNSARNAGGNAVGDTSIKYGRIIDLD